MFKTNNYFICIKDLEKLNSFEKGILLQSWLNAMVKKPSLIKRVARFTLKTLGTVLDAFLTVTR